ncbi:MAG: terminase small subunit, partial [Stellaceae bacterium]
HRGQTAARLLRHKEVAAAIAAAEAARGAQRRVTADRILDEYARIAFADLRAFIDWGPAHVKLRDNRKLTEWEAGAIATVEPPRGNGKSGRLKLYDKQAALETLARHTGLFGKPSGKPTDHRQANRDARAVLVERLKRLARGDAEPQSS